VSQEIEKKVEELAQRLFMQLSPCDCSECKGEDMTVIFPALREMAAHAYRDAATVLRSLKTGGHRQNDNTREEAALTLERKALEVSDEG
jgi:hypothetical protein